LPCAVLWAQRNAEIRRGANSLPLANAARAWLLATCTDAQQRNGAEALKAAQLAISLQDHWKFHDALAAAYAELGRFEDAVSEVKVAQVSSGRSESSASWRSGMASRLTLYQSGQAYREPASDAVATEWHAVAQH
jgi:hypothetical protein